MKKKIVHFVMSLWPAGVEMWLLRLINEMDKDKYEFHVIVQQEKQALLEKDFEKIGVTIHRCVGAPNPFVFTKNFIKIINLIGKVDVMHSHVHHFSGFILLLSWFFGINVRVAHCHNDTRLDREKDHLLRKIYNILMGVMVKQFSNRKIAVSDDSGIDLFKTNKNVLLMPCGIDLAEFQKKRKLRIEYLKEFGISQNAKIIMHVGRFTAQKNHKFLIEIFNEILHFEPNAVLCLIGTGELCNVIVSQVANFKINKSVFLLGVRRDIPQLLLSLADIFVFPSIHEGLPVSLIEAQAAGVPCIMSDRISNKAIVNSSIVKVVPINEGLAPWRDAIISTIANPSFDKIEAFKLVEKSIFNIKENAVILEKTYEQTTLI